MKPDAKQIYQIAKQAHANIYRIAKQLESEIAEDNLAELTDLSYSLRETIEFLEDVRKECKKLRGWVDKQAILQWMQHAAETGEQNRIGTQYCSAEPDIKHTASLPLKRRYNPEAFDALMKWLGVPENLIEKEIVRPSWEGFTNYFTELQQEGKPLPPGIDPSKQYSEYTLKIRRRKDIDES